MAWGGSSLCAFGRGVASSPDVFASHLLTLYAFLYALRRDVLRDPAATNRRTARL